MGHAFFFFFFYTLFLLFLQKKGRRYMVLIADGAIINQLDPSRLIVPRAFLSTLFYS